MEPPSPVLRGGLYGETLLLEFAEEPLEQYSVSYEPNRHHLQDVVPRQLFETRYRSPQLPLWEIGDGEWLKVVRMLPSLHRDCHERTAEQLVLFASLGRKPGGKCAGSMGE